MTTRKALLVAGIGVGRSATRGEVAGINGDCMVSVSVTAVLRSHAQILENMAVKVEELARRTADMGEARKLRQLSNTYRLLALQHQGWFERKDDDKPHGKSDKQAAG